MSAYFETNKDRYFDLLFDVSASNNWASWVEFCLEGVIVQANDAAERCRKLLDLRDKLVRKLRDAGGNTRLVTAIDQLVRNPVMTIAEHARRANVTYPTAKTDLERLAELGILKVMAHERPKSFVCSQMLKIIYDDVK
jgi:Fic family protein